MNIVYDKVKKPRVFNNYVPIDLTAETMETHARAVYKEMKKRSLDTLIIYGDREHGANFAYLTGFEPRFEEAALVLHKDKRVFLMVGNENIKMARYSFMKNTVVHVPHFSLPGQPMETEKTLVQLCAEAGMTDGTVIGIAGWKMFTSRLEDNTRLFDVPSFLVDAVRKINLNGSVISAGGIFLGQEDGIRNVMNANEIAHYEYGAGLASSRVFSVLEELETGKTEIELADRLVPHGQPVNVTTICAAGERFTNGVVFPRNKKVRAGDPISVTLGLRGGLTSRTAYAAAVKAELPEKARDYVERVAIPYFRAAVMWLQTVAIGRTCGELYEAVENALPQEEYHWFLNPGHLTGQDEWTVSPITKYSKAILKSGMLLQMDIIPSVPGYGGISAEDGIALADAALRNELAQKYPETWERMQARRQYMETELGIALKEEILPMSDILGYLRPLLLDKERALRVT